MSGDVGAGCPTMCDPDCDAPCHEVHQPTAKRTHRPESCGDVGAGVAAVRLSASEHDALVRTVDESYATTGHFPLRPVVETVERIIAERVEAAKAEALLEAADFIAATAGIGKSDNDFGRGWYGALDYTVGTLRNYPEATP